MLRGVDERRPGRTTGLVGLFVAAAGVVAVLMDYNSSGDGPGILVGGILIVAGLLLRIEGAIWATGDAGEVGPADDPPS